MTIPFYKYQGTGNDFVIIDNREHLFSKNDTKLISHICDRRFGVGADGLILLENHPSVDFRMVYYNSDGNESSMCGNGGRCICAFAKMLNIISDKTTFEAIDGMHEAKFEGDMVHLKMKDVTAINRQESFTFLNTGSPHHVQVVDDLDNLDVQKEGAILRYSKRYGREGSNINFISQTGEGSFSVRTYERGVEDETLSCGTGVTAVAIAAYDTGLTNLHNIKLKVQGGNLEVSFEKNDSGYHNIFLIGPATFVFRGEWS